MWATLLTILLIGPIPHPSASEGARADIVLAEAAPADAGKTITGFPPIANPNLGFGLAGITDWSVQQPFLDVMKTARPWTGHLPGQWGGWGHDDLAAGGWLDAQGWPRAMPPDLTGIATLILTDLPEGAGGVAGPYVLTFAGSGRLEIDGRATRLQRFPNRALFDYAPGPGSVILTITATDPDDPIRDIRVVRSDRAAAFAAGEVFNPDWLARLDGVRSLRFMDWMSTNDSTLARLADRPKPADYTWGRNGVPVEVMVALANRLGADPWFTLPHLAEDALVRHYAVAARDGLDPSLRAHVEFSNEVWNWQFAQSRWADEQALARWGARDAWVQFYALRASQVADIWSEVYGPDAPDRLVRVIATQTGWLGLEETILDAPLVVAEGRALPWQSFDAYAVTGYFSALLGGEDKRAAVNDWLTQSRAAARQEAASLGLTGDAAAAHVDAHAFDGAIALAATDLADGSVTGDAADTLADLTGRVWPHHKRVAEARGLDLVMYEGGSHVVGYGMAVDDADLTAFFTRLGYAPQMGDLYATLLAGWAGVSDAPFMAFVDVATPGKWGSWGALRHLGDDNPRFRALATGCRAAC